MDVSIEINERGRAKRHNITVGVSYVITTAVEGHKQAKENLAVLRGAVILWCHISDVVHVCPITGL